MTDLKLNDAEFEAAITQSRAVAVPVVTQCALPPDFGSAAVASAFAVVDAACTAAADALATVAANIAADLDAAQSSLDAADRALASGAR